MAEPQQDPQAEREAHGAFVARRHREGEFGFSPKGVEERGYSGRPPRAALRPVRDPGPSIPSAQSDGSVDPQSAPPTEDSSAG